MNDDDGRHQTKKGIDTLTQLSKAKDLKTNFSAPTALYCALPILDRKPRLSRANEAAPPSLLNKGHVPNIVEQRQIRSAGLVNDVDGDGHQAGKGRRERRGVERIDESARRYRRVENEVGDESLAAELRGAERR